MPDAASTSTTARLLVELQSLGVRVVDESPDALPGRRGGAGPVGRAVPVGARAAADGARRTPRYVARSPYTLRRRGRAARRCTATTSWSARSTLPPRPRIYDMQTADGVPYWKIALLHLDSIASTVVQKCIYWGTPEQCGFCGIELTRGEQTIPVKTPAQLAEVCTAARDLDHAVDVTLTTGSLNRRDRGAIYISRCAAAIKEACGLPDPGPVRAARRPARARRGPPRRRRRGRHPRRDVRPRGARARGAPARRSAASRATSDCWERAVEVFGRGSVTTYVLLGMGERPRADRRGLPARDRDGRLPVRRAAAARCRAR